MDKLQYEYQIVSYDPVSHDGVWRGTDACVERLNYGAELGWIVTAQWVQPDTGVWFFLVVREKDNGA